MHASPASISNSPTACCQIPDAHYILQRELDASYFAASKRRDSGPVELITKRKMQEYGCGFQRRDISMVSSTDFKITEKTMDAFVSDMLTRSTASTSDRAKSMKANDSKTASSRQALLSTRDCTKKYMSIFLVELALFIAHLCIVIILPALFVALAVSRAAFDSQSYSPAVAREHGLLTVQDAVYNPDSLFAVQYSVDFTTYAVLAFFFTIALIGVVSFTFSCFEPHSHSTTTQEQPGKNEDVGTSKLAVHSNNERTEQGNKANQFCSAMSKFDFSHIEKGAVITSALILAAMIAYFVLAMTWFVLGAIINPEVYLAYAAGTVTFISTISTKVSAMYSASTDLIVKVRGCKMPSEPSHISQRVTERLYCRSRNKSLESWMKGLPGACGTCRFMPAV
jgi:hypothetical protein